MIDGQAFKIEELLCCENMISFRLDGQKTDGCVIKSEDKLYVHSDGTGPLLFNIISPFPEKEDAYEKGRKYRSV